MRLVTVQSQVPCYCILLSGSLDGDYCQARSHLHYISYYFRNNSSTFTEFFTAFIFSLLCFFIFIIFKGLFVTSLSQKEYWDGHVHSAIFKIDKQQDPTL